MAADGSLRVNAITFSGLSYRVESTVPVLDLDVLASAGGELRPLAEAVEEGILGVEPADVEPPTQPRRSTRTWRCLLDPAITQLAAEVTAGAQSPFERRCCWRSSSTRSTTAPTSQPATPPSTWRPG